MRLYVLRPHATKPNRWTGEWLKGETTMEDAPTEAAALLADSRDTIRCVKIWDDRHGQFVSLTFAKDWSADGLRAGEGQ